ncbi:uncharacterized protein LOC126837880 [Adelges cooleyi]|uniref:uncharacterized protein LOC126837880 n=1 Tax=Adelges cooleyi TaxID=133065 RepID=UPI00217F90E1|nr:uncharacterized protein LOC126837880 [Adelges cooleyi]
MITIKIILLFNLVAYAVCGNGDESPKEVETTQLDNDDIVSLSRMTLESSELPNEDEVHVEDYGVGTSNIFNNIANRGTQFNNQGNECVQVFNPVSGGEQVITPSGEVQDNQGLKKFMANPTY